MLQLNFDYAGLIKNRFISILLLFTTTAFISSCSNNSSPSTPAPESGPDDDQIDWNMVANTSTNALITHFWNESGRYWNTTTESQVFAYWTGAHATDVLLDAYLRTGDTLYLDYVDDWYSGVLQQMNGTFINNYYDDMEWNALALLRAYGITGRQKFKHSLENLWNNIKGGWSEVAGGGIMWVKSDPQGKNAISNAPASILASRLYRLSSDESYLDWAKNIYNWQKNTLIDPETGAVWDHIKVQPDGSEIIKKDWVFTYNQGVYLGAALELYQITGEQVYLGDAIKTADYTLNSLTHSVDRILKDEGGGDGGLFKGIFIRYFTLLIMEEDLPKSKRDEYVQFIEHNAETLWREGTNINTLYSSYWKDKPGLYERVDQSVETSGSILMEAVARLQNEGFIERE